MKRILCVLLLAGIALCQTINAADKDDSKYIERVPDVNLRILDDNIWDYSLDTIPPAWQALGVDCRDDFRAPEFARLVKKYMPDVITIQEYSRHMHERFYPLIQKMGYVICTEGTDAAWNNTPIFIKADAVETVECNYVLYTPERWSNKGSKSFTSAVLRMKSGGDLFAVVSTHLWWKSDKAQAGSTQARAAQVRLILSEAEIIQKKYGCPMVVAGDMNCEEKTIPMQQFIIEGFEPCYKIATVYGNNENGHHICSPGDGFSVKSRRKGPDRETGAIDHCFLRNPAAGNGPQAEVKVFDCITSEFTVKLTDHYPNLIDLNIR